MSGSRSSRPIMSAGPATSAGQSAWPVVISLGSIRLDRADLPTAAVSRRASPSSASSGLIGRTTARGGLAVVEAGSMSEYGKSFNASEPAPAGRRRE